MCTGITATWHCERSGGYHEAGSGRKHVKLSVFANNMITVPEIN